MFLMPGSRARVRPRGLGAPNVLTTNYTLRTSDVNGWIEGNAGGGLTITIPTDTILKANLGDVINIVQTGAGQIIISPASGVTMLSSSSKGKTTGQYSAASLYKHATNTWLLFGDIST